MARPQLVVNDDGTCSLVMDETRVLVGRPPVITSYEQLNKWLDLAYQAGRNDLKKEVRDAFAERGIEI